MITSDNGGILDNNGPDKEHAQVISELARQPARPTHVPDVVQGPLDLADQRDHGVEETGHAEGAENADIHAADEVDHALSHVCRLGAEGLQQSRQQRLQPILGAEGLEHRNRHGEEWHERQQGGVDEAHGMEIQHPILERERGHHQRTDEADHYPGGEGTSRPVVP